MVYINFYFMNPEENFSVEDAPLFNQTIITKAAFTPREFVDAVFATPQLKEEFLAWLDTMPVSIDLFIVTKRS